MALKETLKQKIEEFRPRTTKLTKEFGKVVIDQVTIDQASAAPVTSAASSPTSPTSIRRKASASAARPSPRPLRHCRRLPAPSTRPSSPSGTSS